MNQYNTIYIDFSVVDDECSSYKEYIDAIKRNFKGRFKAGISGDCFREGGSVREDLLRIFAEKKNALFLFLMSGILCSNMPFVTEDDKKS